MGSHASPAAPGGDARPPTLEVRVLGAASLVVDGIERAFPAGRPGRLLAALLLARGRPVSAERLVDDVWGEQLPVDARAALHTTVARTRRSLGAAANRLQHGGSGYRFDIAGAVVDADELVAALTVARSRQDLAVYDRALSTWRGTPWGPWADDLAQGESLRLTEAVLAGREERAALLLAAGRGNDAVGELRLLVAETPMRDRPVELLMEALEATGSAAEALAVFTRHREALAEELGLDPAAELVAAQQRVLQRRPVAPRGSSTATAPAPRRDQPGGRDLDAVLPVIYGREGDLADLRGLLDLHRLVTVVGPGGVGKTTLARRVGGGDGADPAHWWVDLATVSTEAGVRAVTAAALAVESFPGGAPQAAFRRRLATAEGLVVLDNCEHVIGPVTDLVVEVLRSGSGLRVLATSRERLGLPEEHVFWLAPLELPRPETADVVAPSLALFLDRARAAAPDLALDEAAVAHAGTLVRALDGVPLAIELAASRVGVVSLATLQHRLEGRLDLLQRHHRRGGPARHQTLTATIEWSYDLLTEDQQRAFRRLSVFAGQFTLDDAEAVLGHGSAEEVIALVERSLLVRPGSDGEYRMLETLRSFARAQLSEAEAQQASAAHASWAASFAATARLGLASAQEAQWHALVERRLPDLGRAVRWSLERGDVVHAERIVAELCEWADSRVRVEVLAWGREIAERAHEGEEAPGVLAAASWHAWNVGEHDLARELARRGIDAGGGFDRPESLPALAAAGDTALAVGDLETAYQLSSRAHPTAVASGQTVYEVYAASGMVLSRVFAGRPCVDELRLLEAAMGRAEASSVLALGLYSKAEALSEHAPHEALELFAQARAIGATVDARLAVGVSLAAETALLGRVGVLGPQTVEPTVRAIEHWLGSGSDNLLVTCLRNVAVLLGRFGAHHESIVLLAVTSAHTTQRPPYGAEKERLDALLAHARGVMSGDQLARAWDEGLRCSLEDAARRAIGELKALA